MQPDLVVVKVGGSLFDLRDLGSRLTVWLARYVPGPVLLIPGGGPAAEVIRRLDRTHQLGEETSHWLALRMLQVNTYVLEQLVPDACVVASPRTSRPLAILDAYAFARQDELHPDHLPHIWDVTSDSLALRVTQVAQAHELILLKSIAWEGENWDEAAWAGVVDAYFPRLWRSSTTPPTRVVNLRAWLPPS